MPIKHRPFFGPQAWRCVLITGASSGLGQAMAMALAQPGRRLVITGRSQARLASVTQALEAQGAEVVAKVMDVRNRAAMQAWLEALDQQAPFDLIIANAGVSAATLDDTADGAPETKDDLHALCAVFDVNLGGVLNTLAPLIPPMQARGRGQIALISSLAGVRGLAHAPGYSASKVAVAALAEALRGRLAGEGIGVTLVMPGFMRSRITDANRFPMPGFLEAEQGAQRILKGVAGNAALVAFPWYLLWGLRLLALLPTRLYTRLIRP